MAACGHSVGRLQTFLLRPNYLKSVCVQPVRSKWYRNPDRSNDILPPLSQRLAEFKQAYDKVPTNEGINIGLPFNSSTNSNTSLKKLSKWSKERPEREKAARHRELKVDLDEVQTEWNTESGPRHVRQVAKHYGIFQDMFDGAHFNPVVSLDVSYDYDDEFVTPIRYGNIIPAKEAAIPPSAVYESDPDSLWTLVMSSPDGNLEQNDKELLHWMVGNIPGNEVNNGDTLCDYLQPFPVKGAGFLRYVFVLYKQAGPIPLDSERRSPDCRSLRDRSFSTLEFYRQHEDLLTPAGLAFFQSEWDGTIKSVFHDVLDMPEPKFEFIHPPPYFKEQEEVPHKRSFHMYLDNYRDVKDIQEEVIKYKLKTIKDPTTPPPPRPKYANIDTIPITTPSWIKHKTEFKRLGKFHWKQLYEDPKE